MDCNFYHFLGIIAKNNHGLLSFQEFSWYIRGGVMHELH